MLFHWQVGELDVVCFESWWVQCSIVGESGVVLLKMRKNEPAARVFSTVKLIPPPAAWTLIREHFETRKQGVVQLFNVDSIPNKIYTRRCVEALHQKCMKENVFLPLSLNCSPKVTSKYCCCCFWFMGFITPFFELFTEVDLQVLLLLLLTLVHWFLPPILPSCQVQGSVMIVVQSSFRSLKTILWSKK